jgi:hypothetical protein
MLALRRDQLGETDAWIERVGARDPGANLPPSEAQRARSEQLSELEIHATEADRLSAALDIIVRDDPQRTTEATMRDKFRRSVLRKAISEGQTPEDDAFHAKLREEIAARDRERQARKKVAQLAEKRRQPPDPRARSVAAALFSDPWLASAVEKRLRDNVIVIEDGKERHVLSGEFMRVRILEPEDIVVLYTVALVIEEGGFLRLGEPDRGLSTLSNVPASLARLQRNSLIEAERNGNTWRVSWGTRARKIAREAGVSIPA